MTDLSRRSFTAQTAAVAAGTLLIPGLTQCKSGKINIAISVHFAATMAAMELGKHVFVEKSLVTSARGKCLHPQLRFK